MRWYLLLLGLLVIVPSVHAAATIADIYSATSEAEKYYGGVGDACQDLDPLCSDSEYGSVSDQYTVLGDGSTSAASAVSVENKSSSQSGFLRLVFHTDGLLSGTYKLRVGHKAGQDPYDAMICSYQNITDLNASTCISVSDEDGGQWHEFEITDIVQYSVGVFDGAVILRYFQTDGNAAEIAEIYLKRPFKIADLSIIAQGVTEAELGTRIENTWNIISPSGVPAITNASCELDKLTDIGGANHESIDISLLNVEYEVAPDNSYFKVYWDVNESAGVVEGYNYELECTGDIGELHIEAFSQFVYINRESGMWDLFDDFVDWFLQLIGITEDIQELVSGEASMVDLRAGFGESVFATTFLTYSDDVVDVNASCYLDVWSPDNSQFLDAGLMNSSGSDGRYTYHLVVPAVEGTFQLRSYCSGSGLQNRTEYAYGGLEVFDNIVMQMIT